MGAEATAGPEQKRGQGGPPSTAVYKGPSHRPHGQPGRGSKAEHGDRGNWQGKKQTQAYLFRRTLPFS